MPSSSTQPSYNVNSMTPITSQLPVHHQLVNLVVIFRINIALCWKITHRAVVFLRITTTYRRVRSFRRTASHRRTPFSLPFWYSLRRIYIIVHPIIIRRLPRTQYTKVLRCRFLTRRFLKTTLLWVGINVMEAWILPNFRVNRRGTFFVRRFTWLIRVLAAVVQIRRLRWVLRHLYQAQPTARVVAGARITSPLRIIRFYLITPTSVPSIKRSEYFHFRNRCDRKSRE